MAATDKPLRDQRIMDIVFAVTSIAMLVSVIMMSAQDYFREWKVEQRVFRDVESKLAQRMALDQMPSEEELNEATGAVADARKKREEQDPKVRELKAELAKLEPQREETEARVNAVNADKVSIQSLLYIETGTHPFGSEKADAYNKQLMELDASLAKATAARDAVLAEMKARQAVLDDIDADLTRQLGNLKKLNDKFDAFTKLAQKKEWGWADTIRSLWIIDGFASPTKIQQITNNDYGINYNFKDVTRFDRCTTCHLGIDRPNYTKEKLRELTEVTIAQKQSLTYAREDLQRRKAALKGLPEEKTVPDPSSISLGTVSESSLTPSRVNEYCVHPRLDLFVGPTSKHPMEKFGCTSCHNGQGSSTSFHWASHTPNDPEAEHRWKEKLGWSHIHPGDWEFPMNPQRFIESSCLKCHYQVTDLISSDNRNEAPKLLRGYNLIRDNGCFGCHEISGRKGGRDVGPDLRLESIPPLSEMTATERAKIESDPDNKPGNLRKVGPSLYRFAEKSNPQFTVKWLRAPREFRPDTKMPHFYGVANNDKEALKGTGQENFPAAEMHAITHYLFHASNDFLAEIVKFKGDTAAAQQKDNDLVQKLVVQGKLSADEKKSLEDAQRRIRLRSAKTLEDLTGGYAGDATKGRKLFIERGCLSCHSHQATETAEGKEGTPEYSPAIVGEAQFGPNLSQVTAKLGKATGDTKSAKIWLVQWLLDPQVHSPRSRMPITHLTDKEATDVATWLLAQKATDFGPNWAALDIPAPEKKDLEDLAKVYLTRVLSEADMDSFFKNQKLDNALVVSSLPLEEREFVQTYAAQGEVALKHFVGKRGVGRQGCYACHDIPGFDSARPIGVGLNDWGKKDASKLAFEDIANYFMKHYYSVPKWTDDAGNVYGPKKFKTDEHGHMVESVKLPYEQFFADSLLHHGREGYLFQKLNEPRSYDFARTRAWDDRARMPQFRFARAKAIKKRAGESDSEFAARSKVEEGANLKAEAEAREAVMTFVLGLLAEPVPEKMINTPSGDRLAEVKGRQVLENFNCAGCHLVRPGYFELKTNSSTMATLEKIASIKDVPDYFFPNHNKWVGTLQTSPDFIALHGVIRQPPPEKFNDLSTTVRLTDAARFLTRSKEQINFPAATSLPLSSNDFLVPSKAVLESRDASRGFQKDKGQYGGRFGDLLVGYLTRKDPKAFKIADPSTGDSNEARPLVPPSLLGQGERTRPEWLYEFLLNPSKVRKMTLLQMPKFNMSPGDAQALVDYFGAVERQQNTGLGLTYPYEQVKQQDAAAESYFKQKSAEYVARLKATKASVGKAEKDSTMFDKRVAELTPIWQAVLKDLQGQTDAVKAKVDAASAKYKDAESADADATKALDEAKKGKDKTAIAAAEAKQALAKAALASATTLKDAWDKESADLADRIKAASVENQQKDWAENNAYLTDAFKLVANKQLCWQCHQINSQEVKNEVQGPPLFLAHKRLRPGWTERWIAHPNRFLPYTSSMPVNFKVDEPNTFSEFFVGTSFDRVQAARDVLMVLPRVTEIPANRYWLLPLTGDAK